MKVLFIADIVGSPGMRAVGRLLPILREGWGVSFVIANAENSAGGFGVTRSLADELFSWGVDVITSGNHIWHNEDIFPYLDDPTKPVLRPHNYSRACPGKGVFLGSEIAVINLLGRDGMNAEVACPFESLKGVLHDMELGESLVFVDIHGLNPGEKKALAFCFADSVHAVVGTHTHTQTADAQIVADTTAYLSDLGMTGVLEGVQGGTPDTMISFYAESMRSESEEGSCLIVPEVCLAKGRAHVQGALVTVDISRRKAIDIAPISIAEDERPDDLVGTAVL